MTLCATGWSATSSMPMRNGTPRMLRRRQARGRRTGDVVLCPDVARSQAQTAGHGTEDELHLLCTHGVLHLLGYDHGEPAEEREMFSTQARLLQSWSEARQR